MNIQQSTPVIIGVGEVKNQSTKPDRALEPMQLILQAIDLALADTQLSGKSRKALQSAIDSVDIVATWTWPYPDLPSLIAQKLAINPIHKHYSDHGGNQPAKLLDDAARRISSAQCQVALLTGGEALASCTCSNMTTTFLLTEHNSSHSECLCSCW
jgi:hypothetical protein